ncbi:hypothetical protein FGO68_gene3375 [Halteria grandinella]|uniref:Uncharacterized protein n=1 Tax=Halteria grandinella TaxID=5974 RepID=A0A8J8NA75_HALGN|nr:hypothetical protein FGO68_gene3375 [Halteria grandinella]
MLSQACKTLHKHSFHLPQLRDIAQKAQSKERIIPLDIEASHEQRQGQQNDIDEDTFSSIEVDEEQSANMDVSQLTMNAQRSQGQ